MPIPTAEELVRRKCAPCEGIQKPIEPEEADRLLASVPGWRLSANGKRLQRSWVVKNFQAGIDFFDKLATLAESEGHHPDLHLEGYRNVSIDVWTHAIGGLSENDFILAAKISAVPVLLPRPAKP